MHNNNTNEILTTKQLREYLGISRTVLDRLLRTNEIPSFRINNSTNPKFNRIRIRKQDVDSWIESRIVKSDKARL